MNFSSLIPKGTLCETNAADYSTSIHGLLAKQRLEEQ